MRQRLKQLPKIKLLHETAILYSINAKEKSLRYDVDILLPNGLVVQEHRVNVVDSPLDMFLGMDIISAGDMALTHRNGKLPLSFQISLSHCIDLEQQQP